MSCNSLVSFYPAVPFLDLNISIKRGVSWSKVSKKSPSRFLLVILKNLANILKSRKEGGVEKRAKYLVIV